MVRDRLSDVSVLTVYIVFFQVPYDSHRCSVRRVGVGDRSHQPCPRPRAPPPVLSCGREGTKHGPIHTKLRCRCVLESSACADGSAGSGFRCTKGCGVWDPRRCVAWDRGGGRGDVTGFSHSGGLSPSTFCLRLQSGTVKAYLNGVRIPGFMTMKTLFVKVFGCIFGVASGLVMYASTAYLRQTF